MGTVHNFQNRSVSIRRLLSGLFALMFVVSLAACGKQTVRIEDFQWKNVDGGVEITDYTGNATYVKIPDMIDDKKVVSVGNTFSDDTTVETLILSKYIEKIDWRQFSNSDIIRLEGPGVRSIYDGLNDCPDRLEELVLPSLEEFYLTTLVRCDSLKYLEIPNVKFIQTYQSFNDLLFHWPASLEEVVIPEDMWYHPNGWCEMWHNGDPGYDAFLGMGIESELSFPEYVGVGDERIFLYGPDCKEITDANKAEIYCNFFQKDTIIVNGVSYDIK